MPPVIESILSLKYNNYLIYIVADNCDISNLKFNDNRVIILRPPETLASNTRSHFYAINHFLCSKILGIAIIDSNKSNRYAYKKYGYGKYEYVGDAE